MYMLIFIKYIAICCDKVCYFHLFKFYTHSLAKFRVTSSISKAAIVTFRVAFFGNGLILPENKRDKKISVFIINIQAVLYIYHQMNFQYNITFYNRTLIKINHVNKIC